MQSSNRSLRCIGRTRHVSRQGQAPSFRRSCGWPSGLHQQRWLPPWRLPLFLDMFFFHERVEHLLSRLPLGIREFGIRKASI